MKVIFKIYSILIVSLCLAPIYTYGQISEGGLPPSFQFSSTLRSTSSTPSYLVPVSIDVDKLIWEDEQATKNDGSPRVAINIPVADSLLNINSSGQWSVLNDSTKIWKQAIKADGAQGLILSYKDFYIPKGAKLFIYNSDLSVVLGAYTEKTNPNGGVFATELISGDQIILEYVTSKESDEKPRIIIDGVGYAYNLRSSNTSKSDETGLNQSEACMINVNCADGRLWQNQKRGVVLIMIKKYSGYWSLCTGSLINNTAQDGKPYVITANHCFPSDAIPEQSIYYFNYEFDSCSNGSAVSSSARTMIGSQILVNTPINGGGDGTLLTLKTNVPDSYKPYYNGWNRTDDGATSGVVIHHPVGDVKKITTYVSKLVDGTFSDGTYTSAGNSAWKVIYDGRSVTQKGSSGSPIFNQDGLIVGTLSGGASFCTRPYDPDYFAKLWYNWDQYVAPAGQAEQKMSVYLDPVETGVTSLVGYDPNPTTGVEDKIINDATKDIVIFPNPVQDYLNINTSSIIKSLSIYDVSGKLIYKQDSYNSSTLSLPISHWNKGIYTVVINTESKRITDKFMKN